MSIDIKSILSQLEGKIFDLAKSNLADYVNQATADGKQLLDTLKNDLTRWTQELADNKITKDDFATLLLGDKDLAEMSALTEAGLALARIDAFKDSLFKLISDTIPQLIKI